MTWLPDMSAPALVLGLVWTVGVVWMTGTVTGWMRPEIEPSSPDTVTVERQITNRDTVTKTVPKIVRRYDTVRHVDTAFVPVPQQWQPQGVIGTAPVDISGDEATLTYWDHRSQQWTQNVYELPIDRWSVGVHADLTAGRWLQATTTLGVSSRAEWGPLEFLGRLGAGYGTVITHRYRAGPVVQATLSLSYDW